MSSKLALVLLTLTISIGAMLTGCGSKDTNTQTASKVSGFSQ